MQPDVLRYAAFTTTPDGGNPAGVVLDASGLGDDQMQSIATEVGYAESAFVVGPSDGAADEGGRRFRLRYFTPLAEIPFCGHATIATAVVLAERVGQGDFVFDTPVGPITLVTKDANGRMTASFTSVDPVASAIPDGVLLEILDVIGCSRADLHGDYPPRFSDAGNKHPIVVLAEQSRFDAFTFEPAAVRDLLDRMNWPATITVMRVIGGHEFEARNLFPVGTITEDPATGAAAAAFGGYLRELGLVIPPAHIVIHQGRHVGRPSLIDVDIPTAGGIVVTGGAVEITG